MKLICRMSHIDWQGNPGTTICKGEIFEIDDPDRIKTWVDAGYVSIVESEEGVDDTAPESPPVDEPVVSAKRYNGRIGKNPKPTTQNPFKKQESVKKTKKS